MWPRSKGLKKLIVAGLMINPFTEEFLFRGVLIFYLGNYFDKLPMFIAIGVVVCLLLHLYQGAWSLTFHLLFCLGAIGLMLSPYGLAAAFAYHVAGDLMPIVNLESSYQSYRSSESVRELYRRERQES